ncbi:UNVERIFIED_CONTAM: hypothetical protein NCL1_26558 [Trichonephila clavipes]
MGVLQIVLRTELTLPHGNVIPSLLDYAMYLLDGLKHSIGIFPLHSRNYFKKGMLIIHLIIVEISNASLAFVAGYLVLVIEEHECISCLESITQVGSSPLFTSITAQDHRCLYYPSKCDGQFCNNGITSTTRKKIDCM